MKKLVLIAGGSTLVYACLAIMMGVLPGIQLSRTPPGPGVVPLTPLQAEGRDVYLSNGCSYCHTQQVRPLPMDKVFGRPSAPGDFAYQTPELLGSARTGPDLTNIGVRQPSEVWQLIHLYNPRAVVPESIMPRFEWLFEVVDEVPAGVTPVPVPAGFAPPRGAVIATPRAEALIAYLLSLKQPPLDGPTGVAAVSGTPASTAAASDSGGFDKANGATLYTSHCSACHQATGAGLPGVFPPLKGNSVANDPDPAKHIDVVLHGLQGAEIDGITYPSPMPPFAATLGDADIADVINHERQSWGNQGTLVTTQQVAAARAKGK
ncbi:MAG: cbb3-type cytochrome c oxidase subunit II [Gammaproteobacteria bacterium]